MTSQPQHMTARTERKASAPRPFLRVYAKWGLLSLLCSPWALPALRSALLDPITINPPAWLRVLLSLLFLANYRVTPFIWHVKMFYPTLRFALSARKWFGISQDPARLTASAIRPQLKLSYLPIGRDLFLDTSTHHRTATLDECDWNGHLSNSSYSKSLDYSRMIHNTERFLKMFHDGGWVALGGSGFSFHREIPMLARYDIRMSIEAWDDKWMYLVGRFVSPPSTKTRKDANKPLLSAAGQPATKNAVTEMLLENETLYCTSVSRYVCKAGRRTIPPWLLIATSGYGTTPSTRENWAKSEQLRIFYLNKEREALQAKTGRKSISAKMEKKLVKKAAILRQYRLESERQGSPDEAWMSREFWHLDEWETRRQEGLKRLQESVGILPAIEK